MAGISHPAVGGEPNCTTPEHRITTATSPSFCQPGTQEDSQMTAHVFSRSKKKICVCIASLAAMLSPLSSNVYLASTVTISNDLGVPIHMIALTITVYMAVQGIAPAFWGPLSDAKGRRPIFFCTILLYIIANLCLALTRKYACLMAFRALQAAGGAATISIASGVIGDIVAPSERGGMIGISSAIRQTAQVLGPVIGGLISHVFGFRAIFWFLTLVGVVVLVGVLALLPETLPSIAGNGTVRLHGIYRPFLYSLMEQPKVCTEKSKTPTKAFKLSSLCAPIRGLFQVDVFVTLFYGAIVYTIHNMVTASTTELLQPRFQLTDLQTGLTFLPNGLGVILGSFAWGKVLDRNWKVYETERRSDEEQRLDSRQTNGFPVEHARIRHSWWLLLVFAGVVCGYGFSLQTHSLPGVLALQFCIAFTAQAVFIMCSSLVIDLFPGAAASATAVQNLVRCSLGAVGVAVIDLMLEDLGPEKTYALCALVVLVGCPLLVVEWIWGQRIREKRSHQLRKSES
ncbi:putative Major facilitator superfamily domain-containing protein [Seiridium unicorne]|uniref:Major facilitator superfamily domain-containing protein n=1 Tax=Seiridium unicorne TaxID=138068 RepID=A0ABR2VCD3_9PEZI